MSSPLKNQIETALATIPEGERSKAAESLLLLNLKDAITSLNYARILNDKAVGLPPTIQKSVTEAIDEFNTKVGDIALAILKFQLTGML